jgi:hypothetical protein
LLDGYIEMNAASGVEVIVCQKDEKETDTSRLDIGLDLISPLPIEHKATKEQNPLVLSQAVITADGSSRNEEVSDEINHFEKNVWKNIYDWFFTRPSNTRSQEKDT